MWVDFYYRKSDISRAAREKLGLRDGNWWVPINLKREVEYPEMLDGVVDSLKQIADVLHELQKERLLE